MSKRVLVVEDEDKLRRVIQAADLVLTDLLLPGIDGLALLAALRRQNSQTPVVVLTAFGSVEIKIVISGNSWDGATGLTTSSAEAASCRRSSQAWGLDLLPAHQAE